MMSGIAFRPMTLFPGHVPLVCPLLCIVPSSETRITINRQQLFGTSSGTPDASRDLKVDITDKAS